MSKKNSSRIGFLHIPKTAGVSVAQAFVHELGADQCALFSDKIIEETFLRRRFVSGHIHFGDVTRDAFLFTFLRDPIRQIASHLMWIDHYNLPQFQQELEGFPEDVKAGIQEIANIDLSNAKSIDNYLQRHPLDSPLRIVNLQSEMLAFKRQGVISMSNRELADLAIRRLGELDFFGLCETLHADMSSLFRMLEFNSDPKLSHLNSSPSERVVDHRLPDVKRVLSKYVQADQWLYEYAINAKSRPSPRTRNPLSLIRMLYRRIASD
ncbi:hypothetical protein [Paraburkholderia sediminicola]|uniref:hypothetical protein n=1 Tax=Paraburkholderia sediminicola TaxID=458836 RepID=UPI0038BD42CB